MPRYYLGVCEGGFDPAAALVGDGKLLAYAEEERFLRNKHANGFYPARSIRFCLDQANIEPTDIAAIAVNWDLPSYTDGTMAEFFRQMQLNWTTDEKTRGWHGRLLGIFNEQAVIERHAMAWRNAFGAVPFPGVRSVPHHYTHALQAYLQSPFDDALCMTVDGSGDKHCTVLWSCRDQRIEPIYEIEMPHSLGWFYAACTEYLGFDAYDGEYKVMGLAAYGKPDADLRAAVANILKANEDGIGYTLDPRFVHYGPHSWSGRFTDYLPELLGRAPRAQNQALEDWHYDFAFAVQEALEEAALRLVRWGQKKAGSRNLCIGGGVGLNVKMNTRLFEVDGVDRIFPHPLCGDSGAAAGAAFAIDWQRTGARPERLETLALGNEEGDDTIEQALKRCRIAYERSDDIAADIARELADGRIVGWFQGRMEAGARALGQRSILADPRQVSARDKVNAVIKYREFWRPFCPSMLVEAADRYLESWDEAPFMVIAFRANERLKHDAPAIVHVDDTVRVQLVRSEVNPLYHRLIAQFEKITGVPVLLNTSFNVKGEPIVCTATDAIRTFHGTGMDVLALGSFIVRKQG